MTNKIQKLDEFLNEIFEKTYEILEKTVTNLTEPGENYWSDMLKIDLKLKNKDTGVVENESVCCKCVVPNAFQAALNVGMFKSETNFYREIVPTLQNFLKNKGVSEMKFFPKFIGGRFNLEGDEIPDANALIVLENLKVQGYDNLDRHIGFDFDTAKVLLNDLAVFHAVPLALKLQQPELFKKIITDNCFVFKMPENNGDFPKDRPPFPFDLFKSILRQDIFCRKHIDIIDKIIEKEKNKSMPGFNLDNKYEGIFATLTHEDIWLNNTMQKFEDNKTVKNKFVDFQMYRINNPALDLLFFLITSVDLASLKNHFDFLLTYYHETFIKTLESLGCDVEPFAYKYFLGVLREAAKSKFLQANLMNVTVIFAKKGAMQDFHKNNEIKVNDVHPVAKAKMCLIFSEFVKRDWLL